MAVPEGVTVTDFWCSKGEKYVLNTNQAVIFQVGTPPMPCQVNAESLPTGNFNLTCVDGNLTVLQ